MTARQLAEIHGRLAQRRYAQLRRAGVQGYLVDRVWDETAAQAHALYRRPWWLRWLPVTRHQSRS